MITKEDQIITKHIDDLARQSLIRDRVIFSDFLDLHSRSLAISIAKANNIYYEFYGGYDEAERVIMAILPIHNHSSFKGIEAYPIRMIKIAPQAPKFARKLTHRDYLGSLMNLGIERKVLGDLLVQDDGALVLCHENFETYIQDNLLSVGNTSVTTTVLGKPNNLEIEAKYTLIKGTIASTRIDNVIKVGFKLSREQASKLILSGRVFLNGQEITKNSTIVTEGAIISVRGHGKFKVRSLGHVTKKGRITIEIDQYT